MREMLRNLMFPTRTTTGLALALFILRFFVGIAFILHGGGKLMHLAEFAAAFGIPAWLALPAMLTQLLGGILLILGAFTPLAALGIAVTMITATIFLIQLGDPFINPTGRGWENSAFYLTASVCLALSGAGPWSLDAWVFGRRRHNPVVDPNRVAPIPTSR